jgi:hypothetical protein
MLNADSVNEDEMYSILCLLRVDEWCIQNYGQKTWKWDSANLGNLGTNGKQLLKWVSKKTEKLGFDTPEKEWSWCWPTNRFSNRIKSGKALKIFLILLQQLFSIKLLGNL